MRAINEVLDQLTDSYSATLDGNEQFSDVQHFAGFWNEFAADTRLRRLRTAICFVEQPIARNATFDRPLGAIADQVPLEIDEADEDISAFPRAIATGYRGVSSKSSKGVYRSLLNRARVAAMNGSNNSRVGGYFMSAEDLCAQAGLAVQQDLALASLIGCKTTERNGHYFGDGRALSSCEHNMKWQANHTGLYEALPDRLCLRIEHGVINLESLFNEGIYG